MLIGVLGLGMLLGLAVGSLALISGYSFLMALWFYALTGTLAVLFFTLLIALRITPRRRNAQRPSLTCPSSEILGQMAL